MAMTHKLVAVRHPINVGRPNGRRKIKMVPYGACMADKIPHHSIVNGMLMMRVPVARDSEQRQLVFTRGEYRQ